MGDAVLEIAKYYKAASKDEAGKPTAGRRAKFNFTLGGHAGPTG